MTEARPAELGDAVQTRNIPRSVDEWEVLLDAGPTIAVEVDAGELALVQQDGQLQLHFAFDSLEAMKQAFGLMWRELQPRLAGTGYPYVQIDLVEHPNRRWIEELLGEADFGPYGEWLEFTHDEPGEVEPPEIPDGLTMRRGTAADFVAIVALEGDAYGEWADGPHATSHRLERAGWVGVLEEDGEVLAYAFNTPIEDGRGAIQSCAVHPDAQDDGLGRVILQAATFQLGGAGARYVLVRTRPDLPKGARLANGLGFAVSRRGVEFRRSTDEDAIARAREELRVRGMKVRFGGWR